MLAVGSILPHRAAAQGNPAAQRNSTDLAAIARRLDMLGAWAVDCRTPPSDANGYLSFVVDRSGRLRHERDFGGGKQDGRDVLDLRALADGAYEVTAQFGGSPPRAWVNVLGTDGRRRTMSNRAVGGENYSVKDGILVHSGKPTDWLTRCTRVTS